MSVKSFVDRTTSLPVKTVDVRIVLVGAIRYDRDVISGPSQGRIVPVLERFFGLNHPAHISGRLSHRSQHQKKADTGTSTSQREKSKNFG